MGKRRCKASLTGHQNSNDFEQALLQQRNNQAKKDEDGSKPPIFSEEHVPQKAALPGFTYDPVSDRYYKTNQSSKVSTGRKREISKTKPNRMETVNNMVSLLFQRQMGISSGFPVNFCRARRLAVEGIDELDKLFAKPDIAFHPDMGVAVSMSNGFVQIPPIIDSSARCRFHRIDPKWNSGLIRCGSTHVALQRSRSQSFSSMLPSCHCDIITVPIQKLLSKCSLNNSIRSFNCPADTSTVWSMEWSGDRSKIFAGNDQGVCTFNMEVDSHSHRASSGRSGSVPGGSILVRCKSPVVTMCTMRDSSGTLSVNHTLLGLRNGTIMLADSRQANSTGSSSGASLNVVQKDALSCCPDHIWCLRNGNQFIAQDKIGCVRVFDIRFMSKKNPYYYICGSQDVSQRNPRLIRNRGFWLSADESLLVTSVVVPGSVAQCANHGTSGSAISGACVTEALGVYNVFSGGCASDGAALYKGVQSVCEAPLAILHTPTIAEGESTDVSQWVKVAANTCVHSDCKTDLGNPWDGLVGVVYSHVSSIQKTSSRVVRGIYS